MLIVHLSDFHVFAHTRQTALVRLDVVDACRKVVSDVAALSPAADAVLLTGDLTDGGSAEDYALLKDVLAPIRAPIFSVPGNHDRRLSLRDAFSNSLPFRSGEDLSYEASLPGIRILALDTLVEGRVEGSLSEAQLRWLGDRLAAPSREMTLILMHHPAFPSGIVPLDRMALVGGREQFGAMVAAHDGPLRIHAGHIHRPFQTMWKGAWCMVGGSPAFQQALQLDNPHEEPGGVQEPYAYFLHLFEGPETVTVHSRYVDL